MRALVRRQVRLGSKGVLGLAAAALVFVAVLCQSGLANAAPHGGGGGFHGGGFGILAWPYYPYPYGWDYYPEYDYDPGQYSAPRIWYYCYDPAGYYPYVTQCNTGWQTVPAS